MITGLQKSTISAVLALWPESKPKPWTYGATFTVGGVNYRVFRYPEVEDGSWTAEAAVRFLGGDFIFSGDGDRRGHGAEVEGMAKHHDLATAVRRSRVEFNKARAKLARRLAKVTP